MDSVDLNPDEQEEKERLIQQLLELRNTLDGMFNALVVSHNSLGHMTHIYEQYDNVEPTCVCPYRVYIRLMSCVIPSIIW